MVRVRDNVPLIPVETLMSAYTSGRFPMCHEDGELYWHDPDPRAIFPLDQLRPNARLLRHIRKAGFRTTVDLDFSGVMRACAGRPDTWIDDRIIASYAALHQAGHAHAVETWLGDRLVGGVYGVSIGQAFFGESMFSLVPNAGTAAFFALVRLLRDRGCLLFDTQYINDHTARLGATEVPRSTFRRMLAKAVQTPAPAWPA
ncbi:MAG: leucyl/phenylalanyl-tRNA--protein transferase [Flavobacteriales bacterium]|nr:leucyl/phenylalanyl-tRNA--protein transferase [Flavobacteriales bacterium]